jgi:hypothetical protein
VCGVSLSPVRDGVCTLWPHVLLRTLQPSHVSKEVPGLPLRGSGHQGVQDVAVAELS